MYIYILRSIETLGHVTLLGMKRLLVMIIITLFGIYIVHVYVDTDIMYFSSVNDYTRLHNFDKCKAKQ